MSDVKLERAMSQTRIRIAPQVNRSKLAILFALAWTIVFILLNFATITTLNRAAYRQAEIATEGEAFAAGRCMAGAYNKTEFEIEKCKQLELCEHSWSCRKLNEKLYDKTVSDYTTGTLLDTAIWYILGVTFFFLAGRTGLALLEALIIGALAVWRSFGKWITN
jgi:hypothetical protein